MRRKTIHINCDLGEGGKQDAQIMPLISACNIACGGHAGTQKSMRNTANLAIANNVEIGAHPSYPDKINFGRKSLQLPKEELKRALAVQISGFLQIVSDCGGKLQHIKPHGALYHDISKKEDIARLFLEVIMGLKEVPTIYAPKNSVISKLALGKIDIVFEAFPDRKYEWDGSLVSRKKPNAVITQKEGVFNQLSNMFLDHKIKAENGMEINCFANTFCLHSDTPNALEILKYLKGKFESKGVQIYQYGN